MNRDTMLRLLEEGIPPKEVSRRKWQEVVNGLLLTDDLLNYFISHCFSSSCALCQVNDTCHTCMLELGLSNCDTDAACSEESHPWRMCKRACERDDRGAAIFYANKILNLLGGGR